MAVMAVIVVRSTIGFRLSWMCPLDEQVVGSDRDIVAALEVERRRLQDDAKRPDLAKEVAARHHRRAWLSSSTASFADYFYPAVTTPMTVAANRFDLDSLRHCFRQQAAQICWQSVVTRITTNRQPPTIARYAVATTVSALGP